MKYSPTDNENYLVYRSRTKGKFWSDITYGPILSRNTAEEWMEIEHAKHPTDWLRLVKVKMETVKEHTSNGDSQ